MTPERILLILFILLSIKVNAQDSVNLSSLRHFTILPAPTYDTTDVVVASIEKVYPEPGEVFLRAEYYYTWVFIECQRVNYTNYQNPFENYTKYYKDGKLLEAGFSISIPKDQIK